jgi:hypothetical protein
MYETNNLNLEIVDISKFPKVYINLKNPSDVKILISEWFRLYQYNQDFTFIFNLDVLNAQLGDISFGLLLSNFIKKIKMLRKKNIQYNLLRESIIIVKKRNNFNFLKTVFSLTSPLSNTYIVDSEEASENLYNKLQNKEEINYSNIRLIKP